MPGRPPADKAARLLENSKHEQENPEEAERAGRITARLNIMLYVGLGTMAIGLIITFVGLGEKGFKTVQLRLIGPLLVVTGLAMTVARIVMCTVPECYNYGERKEIKDSAKHHQIREESEQNPGKQPVQSLMNGRTVYEKSPCSLKKSAEKIENNKRIEDYEDDLSSSSTFSDSEEKVPDFLKN